MGHKTDVTASVHIFPDADNLKAYADVTFRARIGELTMRRFKVISTDSGRLWVAIPQFEYRKAFNKIYVDAVVLSRRAMRRVELVVLKEYDKKLHEQKSHVQVGHS